MFSRSKKRITVKTATVKPAIEETEKTFDPNKVIITPISPIEEQGIKIVTEEEIEEEDD